MFQVQVKRIVAWNAICQFDQFQTAKEACQLYFLSERTHCRVVEYNSDQIVFEMFWDEERRISVSAVFQNFQEEKLSWKEEGF